MRENAISHKTRNVAMIGIFAALYAATSLIPLSAFIGAPSYLALNLLITPVIAILLSPIDAFCAAFLGGLLGLYVAPSQAMFGFFSVFLPVAGATFGSLARHSVKGGAVVSIAFLSVSSVAFLVRNYPFPFFVIPHVIAICLLLIVIFVSNRVKRLEIAIYVFASTMCEQAAMMILATYLLAFPWQVFSTALPLMIYERLVATIGGTIIALPALKYISSRGAA